MIWCDTREQKNQHILKYFDNCLVEYEERKLDTGDYMLAERPTVTVDRKKSLDELAANLCTKDSARFLREARRAAESGLKLIVLCEHGGEIWEKEDVIKWRSRFSRITGGMLYRKMQDVELAYGVQFRFCCKRETGRLILAILANEG